MRYVFGDYLLDTQRYELSYRNQPIKLRPKVFHVLAYLIAHRDRVVSKDELLEQVWPNQFIGDGSLNACLMAVRKAVGDSGQAQRCIQTLHGRGYRFVAEVEEASEEAQLDTSSTLPDTSSRPCPSCQHANPAGATFCNACGALLTGTEALPMDTQQAAPEAQPIQESKTPPAMTPMPVAERRQLTVMCCDLTEATSLAAQLDPEAYREVIRAYQQLCAQVINRFDGYIAQYLGAGLLVYFGYPLAHEDDAQRAGRTGLGILAALETDNSRLEQISGVRLAVRVGIHTGLVVVGDIGDGSRQAPLALGQTPNIAACIQDLAAPNTVVVSAATHQLIEGYFGCESLGMRRLCGAIQPLMLHRVLQDWGIQSRLDIVARRELTPLVGRESEVMLLLERWTRVKEGMGQAVILSGEAGIGKSRLVQVVKDRVAHEGYSSLECRCSPYDQHSAWHPLAGLLHRIFRWQHHDTSETKLKKLEQSLRHYSLPLDETVPLLAALLALPWPDDRYRLVLVSPQQRRQRTLEALLAVLLAVSTKQPLLLIIEDLHWSDPSTLDLLGLVMDQGPTVAIYTLLTCRPPFQPSWGSRAHVTPLVVNRLSRSQVKTMVQRVAGGATLPTAVVQQLIEKTDGVPLFIEEMTKAVLESEWLGEQDGRETFSVSLPTLATPATLQDSLMARLDHLGAAKGIAQAGAAIGREFSYTLLRAVARVDEVTLQQEIARLVQAEIVYQRGTVPQATYVFKHALIQDAAYQSLLKQTRQHYHQRLVEVLEGQFPEVVSAQPELVAYHATEAGLAAPAIDYWQRAGQHAFHKGAYQEAAEHFRRSLALVQTLPSSPERTHNELDLHVALGPVLMITHGVDAPEVEQVYTRAYALCQQVEETSHLFPTLRGLWYFYYARGPSQIARELAERLLSLAQTRQEPALLGEAHMALGLALYHVGAFTLALDHLEQGLAYCDPATRHAVHGVLHPEMACLLMSGMVLWYLGYPDQARTRIHEGLAVAQQLIHPHYQVWGLHIGALFYQFCRDAPAVQELAEALVAQATEQGIQIGLATGRFLRQWALAQEDVCQEGIDLMHQAIVPYRTHGSRAGVVRCLELVSEIQGRYGQIEDGLAVLAEAEALVDNMGEHLDAAELYRLKGELLHKAADGRQQAEGTPEAYFLQALDMARRQQAKSLELRAAMSLSRLWQQQGKRHAAYHLLAETYGWFTEGLDTVDLQEARMLLEELAD